MSDNVRTIILIWGAAILIYLLIANSNGSASVIKSLGNFTTGITGVLQGRSSSV